MKHVPGTVLSGRGVAHKHLKDDAEQIRSVTGQSVYPGTLNVILLKPIQIKRSHSYNLPSGRRYICPASVSGIPVWIHRWPYVPLHVAELISVVRLRDGLGMPGEGQIELSISEDDLDPLSPMSKAAWAACWKFREKFYYTSDAYTQNINLGRLQRVFKACQHP